MRSGGGEGGREGGVRGMNEKRNAMLIYRVSISLLTTEQNLHYKKRCSQEGREG